MHTLCKLNKQVNTASLYLPSYTVQHEEGYKVILQRFKCIYSGQWRANQ